MMHQPFSPDGVHPQISSSLRLIVLAIYYCLFIFSKKLISFIDSLDKCHTSIFNALINNYRHSNYEATIGFPAMYEFEKPRYDEEKGQILAMASMAELEQRGHFLQFMVWIYFILFT